MRNGARAQLRTGLRKPRDPMKNNLLTALIALVFGFAGAGLWSL